MRRACVLLGVAGLAMGAQAQVLKWNIGSGVWSTAGNWDPVNVPNAAGETAHVEIPGTYAITYDSAGAFDTLLILNPDASVTIPSGRTMQLLAPPVTNFGLIRILANAGTTTDATLRFEASGAFVGTGELRLEENVDAVLTGPGGIIITNSAGHKITGAGHIVPSLHNLGLVSANRIGQTLELTGDSTNEATIEATNDATLDLNAGFDLTQTASGLLRADDGTVRFLGGGTVTGGTLTAINGGFFTRQAGTTIVSGITLTDGEFRVQIGGVLGVDAAGLTNNALIRILGNAGTTTDAIFLFSDSATLSGTGELRLEEAADARIIANAGAVGTNGPLHTIAGTGTIDADLVNDGRIVSNIAFQVLFLSGDIANNAEIEAVNSSVVEITGTSNITNGAAGLLRADASDLRFSGSGQVIDAGLFEAINDGLFIRLAGGTTTLRNVVFDAGEMQIQVGGTIQVTGSGLENNGLIRVLGSGGTTTDATIQFGESGSLMGTGTIRLEETTDAVLRAQPGTTITQDAGHSITGAGLVSGPFINHGLISADRNLSTMSFADTFENHGLIRALPGATLLIPNAVVVTQTPGGMIRSDGSSIEFTGISGVIGGSMEAINGGLVSRQSGGITVLEDLAFGQGEFRIQIGGTIAISGGGITNNGLIRVLGSGGTTTDAVIRFDNSATISGTGEVRLEEASDTILGAFGPNTVGTNGTGHTISGIGTISAPLINEGRLSPGLPIGALTNTGNLTCAPSSVLEIEIGGLAVAQFDRLIGTGAKALGGTLKVSFTGGFTPATNNTFTIVSGGSVTGTFASIDAPAIPGRRWVVNYTPTSATLRFACYSDCEGDGDLDVFDFLCFQSEWASQTTYGDCENDGDWDVFDFLCFQGQFASCP